jgi:WD40 repeat protein
VSGSSENQFNIWNINKKDSIGIIGNGEQSYGHMHPVNEVIFSGENSIISTSDDSSVIVWNLL